MVDGQEIVDHWEVVTNREAVNSQGARTPAAIARSNHGIVIVGAAIVGMLESGVADSTVASSGFAFPPVASDNLTFICVCYTRLIVEWEKDLSKK
jgi:hypothetical protein